MTQALDWTGLCQSRRSIRSFQETAPSRQAIAALIQEARWAPSGGNRQPWAVTAVSPERTRALLDRWQERLWTWVLPSYVGLLAEQRPEMTQAQLWDFAQEKVAQAGSVVGSPWLLLVHQVGGGDQTRHHLNNTPVERRSLDFETRIERAVRLTHDVGRCSVAMFAQHLHLGATARGWGSCLQWQWVMLQEEMETEGVLPKGVRLACGVTVGHSAETPSVPARSAVEVGWVD
ncbi:MAG: nitroreductase [Cognaticolwellia sp.]|jgi:nitroreductase